MSHAARPARRIIAPGKLVILGEYGVLDGAGAIVAAVNRGVICEVSGGAGILTPGDDSFVRAAIGARTGRYTFSDWNPTHLAEKPGFGGSAAATVAAVLACGRPVEDAYTVHAEVQGGGSGVDVFASIHGGVRHFPDGQEVPCPPIVAIWAGHSARTGPRVARYLAWPGRAGFALAMRELVDRFREWPIGAVAEGYGLLRAMSAAADIDYDLPIFEQISTLALAYGGAAKPSGAGGGDVAVALLPDTDALLHFERACDDAGLTRIPVHIAGPAGEG